MSYLTLTKGIPDFTKAVISLWFRVPQESIDKCLAKTLAIPPLFPADPPHLYGIIPFVVFGRLQTTPIITNELVAMGSYMDGAIPFTTYKEAITVTDDVYLDPSVIGLRLNIDENAGVLIGLNVYGNLQTSASGTIEGLPQIYSGGPTFISDGDVDFVNGQTVSWYYPPQPQGPQAYGFSIDVDLKDFADKWHHILLSCDLSHTVSGTSDSSTLIGGITGANHVWVALDDVNYDKYSLTNYFGGGDNDVCSNAIITANGQQTPPYFLPLLGSIPTIADLTSIVNGVLGGTPTTDIPATCTVPGAPIPASSGPLGLPATDSFIDNVYHVEMAEFQLFAGVALDTGVETSRRAFVHKNGKPVPPNKKASKTDQQSGSIEFLRQRPVVLLHKSGNWKTGYNTGSSGTDSKGKKISSGQFVPTAKIASYKPEPMLGK